MIDELLTAKEVATTLKISKSEVYELHHQGMLRASFKLFGDSNRGLRWTQYDLDRFVESCRVRPKITNLLEELKNRKSTNYRGVRTAKSGR